MYASYRVVNQVRQKISTPYVTASDTDVAKALDVSRAAISAWKHGRERMGPEALLRSQILLELDDVECLDLFLEIMGELHRSYPVQEVRSMWIGFRKAVRELRSKAASILLPLGAGIPALSAAYTLAKSGVCILRQIARRPGIAAT